MKRALFVILACSAFFAAPLFAATIEVTSTANSGAGTLRQAFADAEANGPGGDTILFHNDLAGQTIALTQSITIASGVVTVNGGTVSSGVTITGSNSVTIFRVEVGAELSVFQVNLSQGVDVAGSGALTNQGSTSLNRCNVSGHSGTFGGAINSTGTLSLTSCNLSGNNATQPGGAIYSTGTTTITHCTIAGNSASTVGGGLAVGAGTTTMSQTIVAGNSAPTGADINVGSGGASLVRAGQNIVQTLTVAIGGLSSGPAALNVDPQLAPLGNYGGLTLSRPPLTGSPAIDPVGGATSAALGTDQRDYPRVADAGVQDGAIVDIGAIEVHTVVRNAFTGGPTSLRGVILGATSGQTVTFAPELNGGLIGLFTEVAILRSVILDARSLSNGVTVSSGGTSRQLSIPAGITVEIYEVKFTNGSGQGTVEAGSGGSIANQGTLTLTGCEFSGNIARVNGTSRGGAIYNSFGLLTLRDCTFSGNQASQSGGALYSRTDLAGITTFIQQCTFSGNSTDGSGGAIYNFDGRVEIRDSTVTANSATNGDGIASFGNVGTQTVCQNCILSGNNGSDVDFVVEATNSFSSGGTNLVGAGNATGVFNQTGDLTGVNDPQLAALGNYGGPVRTRVPVPGSLAIDAGASPQFSEDQRGVARITDGDAVTGAVVDIGATEAAVLADNQPGTLEFALPQSLLTEEGGPQQIQITRTGGVRGAVSVTLNSVLETASATDFTPFVNQVVTLGHGQTLLNVPVTPVADPALRERHESFSLTMSGPTGGAALGTQSSTQIWILDAYDAVNPAGAFSTPRDLTLILEGSGQTTVTGTARDDKGLADVTLSVNGGAFGSIPISRAPDLRTASWTRLVSLVPGINTITIRAVDLRGRLSAPVSRRINYRVVRNMTMAVAGPADSGSLAVSDLGTTSRFVGINYRVTARPRPGFVFDGWTANDFTGTGVTDAAKEVATLTFAMQENLVLTANFRPNPFVAGITGAFNGLVTMDGLSAVPAGNITTGFFRTTVDGRGGFSGRIRIDGSDLPVKGIFHNDGTSRFGKTRTHTLALKRRGRPDLNVSLSLDMGGINGKLTGEVTQTITGLGQAISEIDADRAPFSRSNLVPVAYAGVRSQRYNFITTAESIANDGAGRLRSSYPQGCSVLFLTVVPTGGVAWSGWLADGSRVTGGAVLSQARSFPWFNSLYAGQGCAAAKITLDTAAPDADLIGSNPLWFRPAIASSQWYPAGWSQGIIYSLFGAKYIGAPQPQSPAAGAYNLIWEDGRLVAPIIKSVSLTATDLVTKADPLDTSYSIRFQRASGDASGAFLHSLDGRSTFYRATTLQKGASAGTFGYFLTVPPRPTDGLGQSGLMTLSP